VLLLVLAAPVSVAGRGAGGGARVASGTTGRAREIGTGTMVGAADWAAEQEHAEQEQEE
jgi:hypothetical protein